MSSDEFNSDDAATGERRYKSSGYKTSNHKTSILKNSSKKSNNYSDDDDDDYLGNGSRLSNRNRYDSPLNSYRSEGTSAKPPSGRLQPLTSNRDQKLGNELNSSKRTNNTYESNNYDPFKSRGGALPAITYSPPSSNKNKNNNNFNDSDDSITERYSKSLNKKPSSIDKYNKFEKFDDKNDFKLDKFETKYESKFDNTKYDTYDEEDKKDLNNKYFRSDAPIKNTATNNKSDPLDELYFRGSSSARNPRSNSLDRLRSFNTSSVYNNSNLNGTSSLTGNRLQKHSSTSNLNNIDNASDRSYTINSLNSTSMSIKDAKTRSYLVGSLSALNGKGLLSSEELDRNLVDRKARLLIATWNMGGIKKLPNNLDELVLPDNIQSMPDIYIIGVEEFELNQKDWEIKLQEQIGPTHVKYASYYHGSIGVNIFLRRELIWFCSIAEFEHINLRTGPVNTPVKTKASIVASFQLFGTLMCFICSHFTAGEGNLNARIENYKTTVNNITLPKRLMNNKALASDRTDNFDCVFWLGDLNFLVTKEREKVERKMIDNRLRNSSNYEEVMKFDELNQIIQQDKAFKHFLEGRITFEATYKYDLNSDNFDTSEKCRIPSYCDRILYRSRHKGIITCSYYDLVREIKLSDHRPVYGLYEVSIRPGVDKVPLSYGDFDREVYSAGYQKRQMYRACDIGFGDTSNNKKNKKNTSPCVIQ